jgi:hypothetical protein
MHYLDSNTDLTLGVDLFLNTRIDSSSLVDVEIRDENSNKVVGSFTSVELTEGAYFQSIRLIFVDPTDRDSVPIVKDKKTYNIVLYQGGINVYQNKIYVDTTKDFTQDTTRMTDGEYTSNSTSNDYVII